ncbi:MAG: RNA polymerase sigma-54 factor, partial [Paracoccaceae bacterium]
GLKRAIEQRNANTLAAASEIVRRQSAFLSDRTAFLAPMKLQDVADAVELHPSTVSRVTNAMTIETPRGVMDLRQFFTRGLPARSGETAISTAEIMERIRKMIDGEARAKPLSDATIAARLQADGIQIQRRTVAKYRIGMRIPGSSRRRRETAHPSLR